MPKIKGFFYLPILVLFLSLVSLGCSSSNDDTADDDDDDAESADADQDGDITAATVTSTTLISGDYTPGVSVASDSDGSLKFTVNASDVDGDGEVGEPNINSVTVTSGTTGALIKGASRSAVDGSDVTCGSRSVGEGSTADTFDIVVSLDTTASMGVAAGIIASKISDFAQALEDAGVDASFAGITVGDAFATKSDPSDFTDAISTGSLEDATLPSFDGCERPDTGAALINADAMSTFFDEVETVVGSGCSGNGGTENYLAPLQFGNDGLTWREGAARVMISIGDDCAYTPDSQDGDSIVDPYSPPDPDDLIADLTASGTVVHVIGNDLDYCTDSGYYNLADLPTATGGTFSELGSCGSEDTCEVDLTELPISAAITSGVVEDCATTCDLLESLSGTYTFRISVTIEGSTAVVDVVVTITVDC